MIHNTLVAFLIPMIGGILLDALLGDPHFLPHPIRLFGRIISRCDQHFNRGTHRRCKGAIVAIVLVLCTFGILFAFERLHTVAPILVTLFNTILFYYAIAHRSLIKESAYVEDAVVGEDIDEARRRLSHIVGRDTAELSFRKIRTATLETLAENLSDGVIAPLFFYAIGGIPLMYAYKMINTMDSMIGYKNDRYRDFGRFAALYLDDGANYLPSRLTAWLMVLLPANKRAIQILMRDHSKHASPNSGYPEAALAGILDCRFGGPNLYGGKLVEKPYIGDNDRPLTHGDFLRAVSTNHRVLLISLFLITVLALLLSEIATTLVPD